MTSWIVLRNNETRGPLDTDELVEAIQAGHVNPGDLVREVEGGDWVPLAAHPRFASLFTLATAYIPDRPTVANPYYGPLATSSSPPKVIDPHLVQLPSRHLRKRSVPLMILLTFLTLGFYHPWWQLRTRREIAGLAGKVDVDSPLPLIAIASIAAAILAGFWREDLARIFGYLAAFLQVVHSFRVREALAEFVEQAGQQLHLSALLTFLFEGYYHKYKMNRLRQTTLDSLRVEPTLR